MQRPLERALVAPGAGGSGQRPGGVGVVQAEVGEAAQVDGGEAEVQPGVVGGDAAVRSRRLPGTIQAMDRSNAGRCSRWVPAKSGSVAARVR